MSDSTKTPSPLQRNREFQIGPDLYLSPYRHFKDTELKSLVAELQSYHLTADGLPLKFRLAEGRIRVRIECTEDEQKALWAQLKARCEVETRKAAAVAEARKALREAKQRDYSDNAVRPKLAVMPGKKVGRDVQ